VLVYFTDRRKDATPPVRSAIEILQLVERLNKQRRDEGALEFQVGIGLHMGEIMLINVGGKRRTVHTVLGEPAAVVRALQASAPGGEILVTQEVARDLDGGIPLEAGLEVTAKGQDPPVQVMRVMVDDLEEAPEDLDPPTLT
jgi:class 3 adenylate cyclase